MSAIIRVYNERNTSDAIATFQQDGVVAVEGIFAPSLGRAASEEMSSLSNWGRPQRLETTLGQVSALHDRAALVGDSATDIVLKRLGRLGRFFGMELDQGEAPDIHAVEITGGSKFRYYAGSLGVAGIAVLQGVLVPPPVPGHERPTIDSGAVVFARRNNPVLEQTVATGIVTALVVPSSQAQPSQAAA